VIGRTALGLAGVVGRLALFQSIGWVPGNNLAYGCGWIRQNSVWSLAHASGCDVGRWIRENSDALTWRIRMRCVVDFATEVTESTEVVFRV
jgi:hypothetical protein